MTAKEAIDILGRYDVNFEPHTAEEVMHAIDMAIEALENLPSASPDLSEEDMRLIKKLRSFHNGSYAVALDKLITSACNETKQQATVSSDCISRQDAITAIFDLCDEVDTDNPHVDAIEEVLGNLPSAEPRKKGEWIIDGHHIICNRCKNSMCDRDREGDLIPKNYCPNCGCQMSVGEQE